MLKKLVLLLWKNYIIRRRHWFVTICEILLPALLFVFIAYLRSEFDAGDINSKSPAEIFNPVDQQSLKKEFTTELGSSPLLYAPSMSKFASTVMEKLRNKTNIATKEFESELALLNYYGNLNRSSFEKVYAVIFEDLHSDVSVPTNLKYKIRIASYDQQETALLFPEIIMPGPGWRDIYTSTGFSGLQLLLDEIYMEMCNVKVPYIQVQKFPYPSYTSDTFTIGFTMMISFFAVVSYGFLCPAILKRIVEEKSSGIKELMKMMGLRTWMLWLGWFINAMVINTLSVTIIVLCLTIPMGESGAVLSNSNPLIVWVFLMLYCSAGVTFCFAVSSAFSRPSLAQNIGLLVWFFSYILTAWMVTTEQVSVGLKFLTALLPNFALSMGFHIFLSHEALGEELDWINLFAGNVALGYVFIMLIVDCVIYTLVACYVEAIMPGKYGLAKPVYFIFMLKRAIACIPKLQIFGFSLQPSFWRNTKVDNTELENPNMGKHIVFEPPPVNLTAGIQIRNLHKVYYDSYGRNPKVAVDGINLDMYNGEITALLGHNGAGKTTTMSILTGMVSASSGSVYINDYDITTHLNKVRESLGLCPQHSLLFVDLTVLEHLIFFAMLKGSSLSKAREEAVQLLEQLNLSEKKNNLVSDLSGGMKRKLSLGIALIGNSKVLMLDEPTSGMDPEARRAVWDLLLSMRGQRTILITTHFMEEADVLGDRIAIMDHGIVRCYGTALFLKKHYGTGYQLTLLKQDNCDVNEITKTLQSTIPDVVLKSENGSVLNYSVPTESSAKFPLLFDALESRKSELGISSIGMSITTLDEVFLNVGKETEDEQDGTSDGQTSIEYTKLNHESLEALAFEKLKGWSLCWQQMRSLLIKEIVFMKRKWWILLLHVLVLLILTIVALRDIKEEQLSAVPLELKLEKYGKTVVMYSGDNKQYLETVKKTGSELKQTDNITDGLLSVGESDLVSYHRKYVVAADFSNNITALYSTIAYHSLPISINLIMNSFLSHHTISVTNHPLDPSEEAAGYMRSGSQMEVILNFLILIPLGLLFVTGRFLMMPYDERVKKAKRLQYMSGVSPPMYWLSCFLWDFLLYFIIVNVMLITIIIFDKMGFFSGVKEIGTLMLLLTLYGLSAIPCVYVFSFIGETRAGSFSLYVIVNFLIGLVMPLVVYFLMDSSKHEHIARGLNYMFNLFPQFAVSYALMRFSGQALENNQCKSVSCKQNDKGICCKAFMQDPSNNVKPYLAFASSDNPNGLMLEVLYLAFDGVLFFLILALLDYDIFAMGYETVLRMVFGTNVEAKKELDEDVIQEQDRVDGQLEGTDTILTGQNDIMLVHDLVKKYKGRFAAVKGISFGVMIGECFGLLGVNGAGKTTTFKMLTGDEIPTRGDATILNYTLIKHKKKFLKQIGYCPQFDAVNDTLTGREMLQLYANLRGIPRENIDQEVKKWVTLLGLQEYENRQCGTYSGGNKRKLSTAVALIGDPPIVFLDEPTSGVDPVARRKLWNLLSMMQKSGQSIVLTSHSMDECEALCSRLAIMVAGQFVCMGPIQYLKQKFGQGFTIKMKLKVTDDYHEQVQYVKSSFEQHPLFVGNCALKDEHQGLLHYHITNSNILWSQLFETMQELKITHSTIEDYTVTETTLEQVFLHFAKREATEETED